ncbi:hypothetical protein PoB_003198400 [Plakobranchus ocellatus]|uniref:Uncharacterized protein n=1 Tax=Plakobranchus ocellatus TaxID=259542 RepID=A0AAV4ACV9_9GAST|nr:hypothetical protein PoB_003198400 [Plakobranchus ocellatus]
MIRVSSSDESMIGCDVLCCDVMLWPMEGRVLACGTARADKSCAACRLWRGTSEKKEKREENRDSVTEKRHLSFANFCLLSFYGSVRAGSNLRFWLLRALLLSQCNQHLLWFITNMPTLILYSEGLANPSGRMQYINVWLL